MIIHWTKKELAYFKKHYKTTLDKNLSTELGRSLKAVSYMAFKLRLKKDKDFYSKTRKKTDINITKKSLNRLYHKEKKSIRKIASEFKLNKTTIEYYFKKYNISLRSYSEANKLHAKESNWNRGLSKEFDLRIKQLSKNVKKAFKKKRKEKFKKIENEYNMPLKDVLDHLYWKKNFTQEQIANRLIISRKIIIDLMKDFSISKRPNFEYIASLKDRNHSHYGKSWEEFFGKEKASKLKKKMSLLSRKNMIKRLKNREMPFLNTQIERVMAEELNKRKIPFKHQFGIDELFVCDFLIPGFNIIVECDGDYWHANPKIYDPSKLHKRQKSNIKRDKIKDKYLTKKGWKMLRFFETDIKFSVKQCVDKIERAMIDELKKVESPLDGLQRRKALRK